MQFGKPNYKIANILGTSTKSIQQTSFSQGCFFYVSGCYIVVYNVEKDEQVIYIQHKTSCISAITISEDELRLAVAESGKYPCITIYDLEGLFKKQRLDLKPMEEFKGHKYGIDLIKYSPNGRYLVSISNQDGSMFVWEKGETMSRNKLTKHINQIAFDKDDNLIMVGRGYFKLWKFAKGEIIRKKEDETWMMEGKVMAFGKKFNTKDFIDVALYQRDQNKPDPEIDKIILLSSDGELCILKANYQKLEKWIDIAMEKTKCIDIHQYMALCCGDNALVKVIDLEMLSLKAKFPMPPPINKENISKDEVLQYNENQQFPQCVGIRQIGQHVVTLYQNKTMFFWKLSEQIHAIRSIITHREKINSVCLLEEIEGANITFFSTVSQDNTLRIWHFYGKEFDSKRQSLNLAEVVDLKRNAYCKNLTRIIYTHSEHPIIKMKMYMNKFIACISIHEFLLYSLEDFELTLHETFEDESSMVKNSTIKKNLVTLDVSDELIYIGYDNGNIRVYKPEGERLIKLKEIEFQSNLESLQIYQKNKLLLCGKGKVKSINLETMATFTQYNVQCCTTSSTYLIFCEKKIAHFFSIQKVKKVSSISLSHELDDHQIISLVRTNSWLIVFLTNKNKLVVANFASAILFIEQQNQAITDVEIMQNGEIILISENANIVIKKMQQDKYQQAEQKLKKIFQKAEVSSILEGSVWKSKINNSINKKTSTIDIEQENSIRLSQNDPILSDKSTGLPQVNVPNVNMEYKTDQNKMSIFNPSDIANQVNQIYTNVNHLIKNKAEQLKSPKITINQKSNDALMISSSEDSDIQLVSPGKNFPKENQKKQAMKNENYAPKFTNNLVQSFERSAKEQESSSISGKNKIQEKSINFGFSQFMESNSQDKKVFPTLKQSLQKLTYTESVNAMNAMKSSDLKRQQFARSTEELLRQYQKIKGNKEFIHSLILENYQYYAKIYELLDLVIGEDKRKQQKKNIIQKYSQLSSKFEDYLEKELG